MSEWIEHDGSGMPVDGNVNVYVKTRDGWTDEGFRVPWDASFWGSDKYPDMSSWVWPTGTEDPFYDSRIIAYKTVP